MNQISSRYHWTGFLAIIFLALSTQSCVKHQQLLLFDEDEISSYKTATTAAITLEPDDIVILYIAPDRPENKDIVAPYNIADEPYEYVVDQEGYLTLPFDKVYVNGLTMVQAREEIRSSLKRYLTNPAVILKLKTFKITVMGEVVTPGNFEIKEERISLLEAIGLAGGLTVYANREQIQVVREKNNEVIFRNINLHDRDFTKSEFFYLKQNDLINIPPIKQRTASIADPNTRIIPYLGLITGVVNFVLILGKL
jgi:polysaccharide export outer membrane protein